jgi:hypothetical protein
VGVVKEYTAEMAHVAAARGAAWLDKRCPDWPREIDKGKLDLSDADVCILGQTATCLVGGEPSYADSENGFTRAANHFWPNSDAWPVRLGFEKPSWGKTRIAYEMLTIAWKEQIRQRLEATP